MKVNFVRLKLESSQPSNVYAYAFCGLFVAYALSLLFAIDPARIKDSDVRSDVTVVNDKFVCVQFMYTVHIAFCWLMFLSGTLAIVFRLLSFVVAHKRFFNGLHMWAGRAYILSLLWTVATSSLIRNEGLPLGTLVSFLWVLGGLTLGYVLIKVDSTSRWSRVTHGALMITSYVGIAGRIFNYNMAKDFRCYAQPAYKSNATLIPSEDPAYHKMPWADKEIWGWGLPLAFGPFFGSLWVLWLVVP